MPVQRSLRLSYFDAFFFSLMVGAGESYLPAYALSVGMSQTLAGFFSTVPLISGALIQLISPWIVSKVGSLKKWVVISTALQGFAFVPLIYFSIFGVPNFLILFLIASFYWGAGFAAGTSWNQWMSQLVPAKQATSFFARRHRISQIGILLGLVGGGYALQMNWTVGPFTSVFSVLFMVAFFSRATSSLLLSAKIRTQDKNITISFRESLQRFYKQKVYRRFFLFMFVFYSTIYISTPFVALYLLGKLGFSYQQYMISIAALFLAKVLTLNLVPGWIERWGLKKVFFIGALGVSPLPAFWGLNQEFWFAPLLQGMSGIFWGILEVCMSMVFFAQLKSEERITVLTVYNLFYSIAIVIGTSIGGQLLHSFGETFSGYYLIFILGGFLRTVVVIGFAILIHKQKYLLSDPAEASTDSPGVLRPIL